MSIRCRIKAVDVQRALNKAEPINKAVVTAVTQAALRDSEPYVPRLEGRLRQTAETESIYDEGKLIYGNASVPYAAVHYYAPGNWNYTTPGTGPRWFDKALKEKLAQWITEGAEAAKEEAGK